MHRLILLLFCMVLFINSAVIRNPDSSGEIQQQQQIVDIQMENGENAEENEEEEFVEFAVPLPIDSGQDTISMDDIDLALEMPPPIPRLNKQAKWELIRAYGKDPTTRRRRKHDKLKAARSGRRINVKRDLVAPWRITHTENRNKQVEIPTKPAMALPIDLCPKEFDAVTRAYNGRIYLFGRDKASYMITDLFPGGPRTVTAALTNSRSGVTILISGRTAYRFRWNKKHRRFHLAKNTPQEMPRNITINPQTAFEWYDGNQVVVSGPHFFIYDAYWNLATFQGHTRKYFPNLPTDIIGITYNGGTTLLMFTKSNSIKVYNTKRYKVVQEYPINISSYAGCLTEQPKPAKAEKPKRNQKQSQKLRG